MEVRSHGTSEASPRKLAFLTTETEVIGVFCAEKQRDSTFCFKRTFWFLYQELRGYTEGSKEKSLETYSHLRRDDGCLDQGSSSGGSEK